MDQQVRVRMAPSPTGFLHIGTARTALFNFLFAKKYHGTFIMRIEDTDGERSDARYEADILEGLRWLGITWDEGPDIGGPTGPYRQSERMGVYEEYLRKLYAGGFLYECFCSKEELERERELQVLAKLPPRYSGKCRTLEPDQRKQALQEGKRFVLRFAMQSASFDVTDLIRGTITFETKDFDDFIIAKDFRTPLFNFAVVIDDELMKITHIIRGEEHLANIPKQILLAQALGFQVPQFAHIPLILNRDHTKLSKRQNRVSLLEFRELGYLPQAMINFMAFLGWNPGGERELYTLDEMGEIFDVAHVHKSGAIFNQEKLDWFNGQYIRQLSLDHLTALCLPYLVQAGSLKEEGSGYRYGENGDELSYDELTRIVESERSRIKSLKEIGERTRYLFVEQPVYDPDLLLWKDMTREEVYEGLEWSIRVLAAYDLEMYILEKIEPQLKKDILDAGLENGKILWPLRVALSGLGASPSPFEIMEIIGKQRTLDRIGHALAIIS